MAEQDSQNISARNQFLEGARAGLPVIVAAAPFGLLYGTIAAQQGLTPFEAALMSAAIYAGASQMVGLELFGQKIAPWVVVMSIFAVNFRHVLYSAAVGRRVGHWAGWQKALGFFFLVDPQYAETERRGEAGLPITFSWYMGMALSIYVLWIIEAPIGAIFGRMIPDTHALGLDFLLPIYFLGLVMGFRKRPLWVPVVLASGVVSVVAYHVVGSPWHVSIGAAAGILLAAALTPAAPHDFTDPEPNDSGGGP